MTMADKIVVMNNGNIEQSGPPLELYDRPANLFVAGFIGSPAMNFLKGTIEKGTFKAEDGMSWPLPVNGHAHREGPAIYGMRPEHLTIDSAGVPTTVQIVEPTGSETQVTLRAGDATIVGAFRERVMQRPGENLSIRPDTALVHLFDPETGQRL
jgi:multiple sugar transport system ATP-binding protein